jgi:hypothetical protein
VVQTHPDGIARPAAASVAIDDTDDDRRGGVTIVRPHRGGVRNEWSNGNR